MSMPQMSDFRNSQLIIVTLTTGLTKLVIYATHPEYVYIPVWINCDLGSNLDISHFRSNLCDNPTELMAQCDIMLCGWVVSLQW